MLFDEVLWYRATLAFSRLLELEKRFDEAAEYLRRSQAVRSKILEMFWPSTKSVANPPPAVADVGDLSS